MWLIYYILLFSVCLFLLFVASDDTKPSEIPDIPIASDIDFQKLSPSPFLAKLINSSYTVAWVMVGDNRIHISYAKDETEESVVGLISGETIHIVLNVMGLHKEDCIDKLGLHTTTILDTCGLSNLDSLLKA